MIRQFCQKVMDALESRPKTATTSLASPLSKRRTRTHQNRSSRALTRITSNDNAVCNLTEHIPSGTVRPSGKGTTKD